MKIFLFECGKGNEVYLVRACSLEEAKELVFQEFRQMLNATAPAAVDAYRWFERELDAPANWLDLAADPSAKVIKVFDQH